VANGQTNVQAISAAIEREGLSWKAAPNEVTALPRAEQIKRLGVIVTPQEQQKLAADKRDAEAREKFGAVVGAPVAVDWRNKGGNWVTSVKNQGGCGSCVSFCSCSTIESAVRIKLGNSNYGIDLSEAFLQFCGGGSCGGRGLTSGLAFAQSTGVTDEACMPYQAMDLNCASSRCSDWQNRLTKISSYTSYATMQARKDAIANIGPVLAGLAVFDDFFAYSSGVYRKTAGSPLAGYHCISCIGYDDNQQCWILKNSWGAGWGDGGFVRIGYGQAELLIDTDWAFYSVAPNVQGGWIGGVTVTQTYASRDSQNAWAYFAGYGWRKIQTGSPDGVTNMLMLFAEAVAKNRTVTVYTDANFVFQAYL